MIRVLIICVSLLLFPLCTFAQGGSNYSSIGFGDLRRSVGALYDGMAGTSIAMPSDHGINTVNPALLGMSVYTRLQAGYRFNQNLINDNGASLKQNNGELDGLMVLFAVDTARGFGISFGVLPYSSVNYLVQRNFSTDIDGTPLTGRSVQSGTGGTSSLQLAASARLGAFYFGLSVQTLFGLITLADNIFVDGFNERVRSTTSNDIRGVLLRGGVYYKASPTLSLGAFVSGGPSASLSTSYRTAGVFSGNTYFDSTIAVESNTQLPFGVGLGASLQDGRSTFGVDLEFTDFSGITIPLPVGAEYVPSLRATFGYNRQAAQYAQTFGEKLGLRAGAGFQRQYYSYKGADVNEFFASGGIDFPLGASATVDAALQGGYRGPSGGSLYDYFMRFTLTVSIGETWFKPFARD
ncbi:MAG: hypothetical protein H7X70_06305 [Candidatus Kapabacteria bacterium]|nr:hypothetical protein [Candidatus Kapabacteria bacterium]